MKFYLASRYSRNDEMRNVRDVLRVLGHEVTSRWIDLHSDMVGNFKKSFTQEFLNEFPNMCAPLGQHDLDDIDEADCIISFTGFGGKGGRHVEFGYALAKEKKLFIVGPRENVFHTLTYVSWFPNWEALVRVIAFGFSDNACQCEPNKMPHAHKGPGCIDVEENQCG